MVERGIGKNNKVINNLKRKKRLKRQIGKK